MISVKRRVVVPLVGVILLSIILMGIFGGDPRAPRFVPVQMQPSGPYRAMYYNWGDDWGPGQDGKMWLWTVPVATNGHIQHYLYDFKSGRVAGELLNAVPMYANADQTKLLCNGFSGSATLKWKIYRWLEKFPVGRRFSGRMNLEEPFWILDLRNNSAVRIGTVFISGSRPFVHFVPSPGFRFGYDDEMPRWNGGEYVLCDLESQQLRRIKIAGTPLGWWDEQNILFLDSHDGFGLLDIRTSATTNFLTRTAISNCLQQLNLPSDAATLRPMSHWNGHDYDVLFTKSTGKSFLLKLERADLSLKLLSRDFEFNSRAHLNKDCTFYVYDGEGPQPGKGGNGGVYLKNLTNNTMVTLVEPDNGGQYSLARFWDGGVIYWRKKHLWRIDLDGSNNVPLIPGSPK
jgi:hypothetical protein